MLQEFAWLCLHYQIPSRYQVNSYLNWYASTLVGRAHILLVKAMGHILLLLAMLAQRLAEDSGQQIRPTAIELCK